MATAAVLVRGVERRGEGPDAGERIVASVKRAGTVLLSTVPVAFLASFITYGVMYLSPVSAAAQIVGPNGTQQEIEQLAKVLGSNRSFLDQYVTWLVHALQGNLGDSYVTHLPVGTSIAQRLPVDLSIAILALILGASVGLTAGILAATHRGKPIDRVITAMCSIGFTIPEFWLAILLVIVFCLTLHIFPASGYVSISSGFGPWFDHAFLPATSLAVFIATGIARQLRTSLIEVLADNFVIGATVRGLSRKRVLFRHALRNAAGPAVAMVGLSVPYLIGGAVIAETVFGLPGLGQFVLQGVQSKDMPVIQGVLVTTIVATLLSNVAVNAVLGWLRPGTRA